MIVHTDLESPVSNADLEYVLPRALLCPDFDRSCFRVVDPAGCKKGRTVLIDGSRYYTLPVLAICPLAGSEE